MKAIEAAYARDYFEQIVPVQTIMGNPYAYPNLNPEVSLKISGIRAYHDMLMRYEADNAIAESVLPSVDAV